MQVWLSQIDAVELVYGWSISGEIRRIDPRGVPDISGVECFGRYRAAERVRLWLVIKLEQTTARINAGVIQLAALGCLELHLGWTAIVALFKDFKRHSAGHNGQIQADREQKSTNPALAERGPVSCNPLNHCVFLAV